MYLEDIRNFSELAKPQYVFETMSQERTSLLALEIGLFDSSWLLIQLPSAEYKEDHISQFFLEFELIVNF